MEAVQHNIQAQSQAQAQPQFETFNYSADTSNVMSILVKSIYTNKDIFIRELISNASDAINKVCMIDLKYSLNNSIKISYSTISNQIIIQDSGCGITKQDLIDKIGSIGTSGTKHFMEAITQSKEKLIGQFGVGFYSIYLVAESIQIITKPVQEPNKIYEWISDSESSYSIRELVNGDGDGVGDVNGVGYGIGDVNEFKRGTKITITLRSDSLKYLEQDKLIDIIKTHSSYIEHPIMFEKQEYKKDSNGKYLDEKEKIWEKMNWFPLWAKPKSTISEQDYVDFYLHNIQDNLEQHVKEPPLVYKHFSVEGVVNFTGLLYIPTNAPFNLFEPSKRGQSLKLYTKNVLITADHKDLYPRWMEFIKGIVDTSDIELNVSRQTVQNTKKLRKIYNQLVKKVVEMLEELVQDETKYLQFYKEFSCSLKNGIHEEYSREPSDDSDRMAGNGFGKRMLKLLKFHTSHGRFVGFYDYVKNMKPTQKAIYYIAGDKKESLELSPFMDKLKQLDLEVLYFEENIDEYIKGFLTEYKINEWGDGDIVGIHDKQFERFKEPDLTDLDTKTFVDVTRDKLLIESNTDEINFAQGDKLCEKLKELYLSMGIKFFEVKLDEKFNSVPAIIVNHVHLSAQLEKLLNNSAATKRNEQYKPAFDRKDMLISSSNKITQYMYQKLCLDNVQLDDPDIIDKAHTIYTMALIAGGYEPDNAFKFIKKVNELLELTF
jgi:HSP90 family molecular chaperone